jgi:uncharacterized protein (DUF983 family)
MDSVEPIIDETAHWRPDRTAEKVAWPVPETMTALGRGFACKCPGCGKTKLFSGYLRVVESCAECTAPLGEYRADDAPPYFTIFTVGHIVVPLMLTIDMHYDIPDWIQTAFWAPASLALTLALLRPIKGATVGMMLRMGMVKAGKNG